MQYSIFIKYKLCFFLILFSLNSFSQPNLIIDSSTHGMRIVVAGPEYKASSWKRFLWGNDYRNEWTTPVTVPVLNLDTIFGGLTPIELGGGRQTKSLHMKDAQGRRFVLRTVSKRYTGALPPIARGTIIETIANDQIATNHPYAALAIPSIADAAGVYHANPKLYLVPYSPRLGAFNSIFANSLCLLEERPDETQIAQTSFGLPKDIDGSEKMVENITGDNDFKMDQHSYIKTRLFDVWIGDWGRHIDNWRWAQFDSGKLNIYKPVPKDRDQTFAKFQGVLFNAIKTFAGLKELQSFGSKINDIAWYNSPAMEIDRRFTNELTRQTWLDSATALQRYLTDNVIEKGIRQLPPEIFAVSGKEIVADLKSRRDDLVKYASAYFDFISKTVEVPGTKKAEHFSVVRKDAETEIKIFKISKNGEVKTDPIYSRIFQNNETSEIRLYGIDGNDVFHLSGRAADGIIVRIIGGPGKDSLIDQSTVSGRTHKTKFYDNPGSSIISSPETKIRLSDTSYVYPFEENYKYDYKGYSIYPGLNNFYRLFVGVGFKQRKHGWREKPFKSEIRYGVNYSFSEKTLHPYLKFVRPHLFGLWNMTLDAGYDGSRRVNYYGLGNETKKVVEDDAYYFLRTENLYTGLLFDNLFAKHHTFSFNLFYDGVRVRPQNGFLSKPSTIVENSTFSFKHFAGGGLGYKYSNVNDAILPTKGLNFFADASFTKGIKNTSKSFARFASNMNIYLPLFKPFSILINTGAATISGHPEFYQYNQIGGNANLRGYQRTRFYGKTIFYDQNEIRWIPNIKSYLFNGKAGLIALYDIGRVWQPGEKSNTWHYGYGGGIIISPFNKISATAYYSFSKEDNVINFRIGKYF